jgi:predicted SAM-dependent methyltransferase
MIKKFISRKVFEYVLKKNPFPCKLVVGADGDRYPGWLSTEKKYFDITNEDHWKKYFDVEIPITYEDQIGTRKEKIDGVEQDVKFYMDVPEEKIEIRKMQVISHILADHVFQELTEADAIQALVYAKRYLTPGGKIRIAVPDDNHRDKQFVQLMQQIYQPKVHYNRDKLLRVVRAAGFKRFQVKENFDAGGLFNISTWYRQEGFVKRSFWYDPNNMANNTGMFWSCLIIDAIKERNSNEKK